MPFKNRSKPKGAEKKTLEPLFGASCATQTYHDLFYTKGTRHISMEAFVDDPHAKTWTVMKITRDTKTGEAGIITKTETVQSGLKFVTAVDIMTEFEKDNAIVPDRLKVLFPTADEMDYAHYRLFAMREGYIFDTDGYAHARPTIRTLPPNATFEQASIAEADAHLKRPENEFDNNGPRGKLPATHFLFDQFTRAAHSKTLDESAREVRVLDLLDKFVGFIDAAYKKMEDYCGTYQLMGRGNLIEDAEEALRSATRVLRQMQAYGVKTGDFQKFVTQSEVTCHILHAEGIYDLMSRGKGDFDENEAVFKKRVSLAVDGFKELDNSEKGIEGLKNMIVQTAKPEAPAAIRLFISNYRAERAAYMSQRPGGKFKPL